MDIHKNRKPSDATSESKNGPPPARDRSPSQSIISNVNTLLSQMQGNNNEMQAAQNKVKEESSQLPKY
jgi:hypothetical protein